MHMMDDPLIKTLLQTKWQRFACAQFLLQFACFLVLVIVQTFLVWVHCDPQKWNSYSREVCVVVFVSPTAGDLCAAAGMHWTRAIVMVLAIAAQPAWVV